MNSTLDKTVYLIRHGQSVDNASPIFQSVNSPLSDKGQRQAAAIGKRMSTISFDALIASPILRAKQTAEAIAATTGAQPEFSKLFVERIKPGSIDGKGWDDPIAIATYKAWEESLYGTGPRVEKGESFADIMQRAAAALELLRMRPEQTIAVVTHGHFLRVLVAQVLLGNSLTGDLLKRFQMLASVENTGITVLRYKDAYEETPCWRLWTLNDHAHFADHRTQQDRPTRGSKLP